MTPERTSEGKWVVYARSNGHRFERWPVDAQQMLDSGAYVASLDAPAVTTDTPQAIAPAVTVTHGTPAEYSPGVPLVVTKSEESAPAQVSPIPSGQTSVAPKGRRGR